MGAYLMDRLAVMAIAVIVIAIGLLAGLTGPVVATGLFGFIGVGAAILIPMSIQYSAQDR